MKKYLLAAALAGASCVPATASNLTYDAYTFSGDNITITSPNAITGGAGPITLYDKGTSLGTFWCMDVDNYLAGSGTVGLLSYTLANADSGLPGVPKTLTQTQLNAIGWLVDLGDKAIGTDAGAAFQIAIWSEEYGSAFKYNAIDSTVTNDVATDLALALGEKGTIGGLEFLVPGVGVDSQTLVGGTPFAAGAPEPSTWAMGIIGFAVLGAMGYRRRAKVLALAS
jgi:hypothetical protein